MFTKPAVAEELVGKPSGDAIAEFVPAVAPEIVTVAV
jgi:hypothetical protein